MTSGPVGLPQAIGKCVCNPAVGEVLAFNIDRAIGGTDRIEEQRLVLANFRVVFDARHGPRDHDVHVQKVGWHVLRPERGVRLAQPREGRPAERPPPIAHERAERGRRRPVHHRLHFVVRLVGLVAGIQAHGFLHAMLAGVPSMSGEIDPAAERELVVDHDHLLMVRAAQRVAGVEGEVQVPRHPPPEPQPGERIAFERVHGRIVPGQQIDLQQRRPPGDVPQQRRKHGRTVGGCFSRQQIGIGHGVPAEDEHRVPRAEHGFAHQPEIIRRILDAVEPVRTIHAPAVHAGLRDEGAIDASAHRRASAVRG